LAQEDLPTDELEDGSGNVHDVAPSHNRLAARKESHIILLLLLEAQIPCNILHGWVPGTDAGLLAAAPLVRPSQPRAVSPSRLNCSHLLSRALSPIVIGDPCRVTPG